MAAMVPVDGKIITAVRWVVQIFAALPTILPAAAAAVGWLIGQLGAESSIVRLATAALAVLTVAAEAASVAQRRGWIRPVLYYLDGRESDGRHVVGS
jgi:hypothetical protein